MKNRNQYQGYHFNTNEYNAYQQTPYHQGGNGPYGQIPKHNRGHEHYPQRQPQYHRGRDLSENYYDRGANSNGLFYLLIVLGFATYGIYLLDKNYGRPIDRLTDSSTVDVPPRGQTDQEPIASPNPPKNDPQNDIRNLPEENLDLGVPAYNYDYPPLPEETVDTEQSTEEKVINAPVAALPQQRYFYTQIGVYQDYQNALKQIEKYRSQGYKAYSVQLKGNTAHHHVLVGEFGSIAEAKAFNNQSGRVFEYLYSIEAFYEW